MLKEYKYIIQKYKFYDTPLSEVNYFSKIANKEIIDEVELINLDYLIDADDIEMNFDTADSLNEKNSIYFEPSDFKITIDGYDEFMKSFFEILKDSKYFKFKLIIKRRDTNEEVFSGIIHQESIEYLREHGENNKNITATALGFEKEFKSYYKTKNIPSYLSSDINWVTEPYIYPVQGLGSDKYYYASASMYDLLTGIFPGINIQLTENVASFRVMKYPLLGTAGINYKKRTNVSPYGYVNDWIFLKTGYNSFSNLGISCYDFFEKLCMSHGWVFYFKNGILHVRDRVTTGANELIVVDSSEIIYPVTAKKTRSYETFSHIVIHNGMIYGRDYTGYGVPATGESIDVISNKVETTRNTIPWTYFSGTRPKHVSGYRWQRFDKEDDKNFEYRIIEWTSNAYGAYNITLDKLNMIMLDTGDPSRFQWGYNVSTGRQFPFEEGYNPEVQPDELRFRGCIGDMVYKVVPYTDYIQSYEEYRKTQSFINNFKKFLNAYDENLIDLQVDKNIYNPNSDIQIINDPEFNGLYGINSLKISLKNNDVKLGVQRRAA